MPPSYEAALQELEQLVGRLESGDLPLEAIRATFAEIYPFWISGSPAGDADFARDALQEPRS